jgi:hypothetical protein
MGQRFANSLQCGIGCWPGDDIPAELAGHLELVAQDFAS